MRKTILLIVLLISVPPTYHCSNLLSSITGWVVSDSEEVALGTKFYEQIAADPATYPLMDTVGNQNNRLLVNYIDSIGRWIATHQTARPENEYLKYKFSVIDDDTTVNAFAIPGGYIFIYTGLIKVARNEAEIAGVLAHELGHITQKHGVKQLVKAMGYEYVKQLIFGDDPNIIIEAMTSLMFLKFSRENEYEADSCSVEFLISAGYNPNGMKTFLELLAENSGWNFEPLSTHPKTEERVDAVASLIATKPNSVNTLPVPDNKAITEGWISYLMSEKVISKIANY